jgi:hypothetical protein
MSISDWMNPVTLKELRQLVRSRLVAAGLIGYLVIALVTVSIVLLSSRFDQKHGISLGEQGLGDTVFSSVYFILTGLLLFATPFFVGVRVGAEGSNERLDRQFTTVLKPRHLVDGKVAASVILILLFAGASLPFLSLAYLLRGLDVIQALLATLMLILVAVACVLEALFLATAATSRVFRVLVILMLFPFQSMMVGGTFGAGVAMVSSSGLSLATWPDAIVPGLFLAGWLSVCLLLRAVTTSLVMPAAANRAPAVRGWILVFWLFWGIIAGIASWRKASTEPFMAWCFISVVFFALFGAVAASGAPGYSRRVLAEVSWRRWRRFLQFYFFSGAENGMLWALLAGGLTILAGLDVESIQALASTRTGSDEPNAMQLAVFFLNLTAYLWTVRAAWRLGLHRWISYRLVGVVTVALVLLGWALPHLAVLGQSGIPETAWHFGNAFAVFDGDLPDITSIATTAAVWAVLALAANAPWMHAAFRKFAPLLPVARDLRDREPANAQWPSRRSGPADARHVR